MNVLSVTYGKLTIFHIGESRPGDDPEADKKPIRLRSISLRRSYFNRDIVAAFTDNRFL